MFVDNTKKIIVLSVPGSDNYFATSFFKDQFKLNSIEVNFSMSSVPASTDLVTSFDASYIDIETNTIKEDAELTAKRRFRMQHPYLEIGKNYKRIQDLISENVLTAPISEYTLYGLCRNPIDRAIVDCEQMAYIAVHSAAIKSIEESANNVVNKSVFESDNIKKLTTDGLIDNYVVDNGEGYTVDATPPEHTKPQSLWLKYNGQPINHIFKYDNYTGFVSAICALYGIDASSYDDSPRISARKTNLTVDELSEEVKNEILQFYAEDKALYDSL